MAVAGDVNGDGFSDIIVGAKNAGTGGTATVLNGVDGTVLRTITGEGGEFAYAVAGAGDVNGDGYADLIIGARNFSDNAASAGAAYVYSGSDGQLLYRYEGQLAEYVGESVAGVGDVNNDGFDDFLIGANRAGNTHGMVYLYSGIDGSLIYQLQGDDKNDQFGDAVAAIDDLNDDGVADFIVGASLDDNNRSGSGSVHVYSAADGKRLFTVDGTGINEMFASRLASAGDVNGDGISDLIVTAKAGKVNGDYSGSVRLLSGINGTLLATFNGNSAYDWLGSDVAAAGDVNADGRADFMAGAYGDDTNGAQTGAIYLMTLLTDSDADGVEDGLDAFPLDETLQ